MSFDPYGEISLSRCPGERIAPVLRDFLPQKNDSRRDGVRRHWSGTADAVRRHPSRTSRGLPRTPSPHLPPSRYASVRVPPSASPAGSQHIPDIRTTRPTAPTPSTGGACESPTRSRRGTPSLSMRSRFSFRSRTFGPWFAFRVLRDRLRAASDLFSAQLLSSTPCSTRFSDSPRFGGFGTPMLTPSSHDAETWSRDGSRIVARAPTARRRHTGLRLRPGGRTPPAGRAHR